MALCPALLLRYRPAVPPLGPHRDASGDGIRSAHEGLRECKSTFAANSAASAALLQDCDDLGHALRHRDVGADGDAHPRAISSPNGTTARRSSPTLRHGSPRCRTPPKSCARATTIDCSTPASTVTGGATAPRSPPSRPTSTRRSRAPLCSGFALPRRPSPARAPPRKTTRSSTLTLRRPLRSAARAICSSRTRRRRACSTAALASTRSAHWRWRCSRDCIASATSTTRRESFVTRILAARSTATRQAATGFGVRCGGRSSATCRSRRWRRGYCMPAADTCR